jgi:hypothetical protein
MTQKGPFCILHEMGENIPFQHRKMICVIFHVPAIGAFFARLQKIIAPAHEN